MRRMPFYALRNKKQTYLSIQHLKLEYPLTSLAGCSLRAWPVVMLIFLLYLSGGDRTLTLGVALLLGRRMLQSWGTELKRHNNCIRISVKYHNQYNRTCHDWWPLLSPCWHPIFTSSHCNLFEDGAPVDKISGCPISKWVATHLNIRNT